MLWQMLSKRQMNFRIKVFHLKCDIFVQEIKIGQKVVSSRRQTARGVLGNLFWWFLFCRRRGLLEKVSPTNTCSGKVVSLLLDSNTMMIFFLSQYERTYRVFFLLVRSKND